MKPKYILTASFPLNDENKQFIKKLDDAAARETNGNRSKLIHQILKKYVDTHDPGNPQQRLDRLIDEKKPYVAPRTCAYCSREAVKVFRWKGKEPRLVALCLHHANIYRKSPNYEATTLEVAEK